MKDLILPCAEHADLIINAAKAEGYEISAITHFSTSFD